MKNVLMPAEAEGHARRADDAGPSVVLWSGRAFGLRIAGRVQLSCDGGQWTSRFPCCASAAAEMMQIARSGGACCYETWSY
jgi:hypothetical protein